MTDATPPTPRRAGTDARRARRRRRPRCPRPSRSRSGSVPTSSATSCRSCCRSLVVGGAGRCSSSTSRASSCRRTATSRSSSVRSSCSSILVGATILVERRRRCASPSIALITARLRRRVIMSRAGSCSDTRRRRARPARPLPAEGPSDVGQARPSSRATRSSSRPTARRVQDRHLQRHADRRAAAQHTFDFDDGKTLFARLGRATRRATPTRAGRSSARPATTRSTARSPATGRRAWRAWSRSPVRRHARPGGSGGRQAAKPPRPAAAR